MIVTCCMGWGGGSSVSSVTKGLNISDVLHVGREGAGLLLPEKVL